MASLTKALVPLNLFFSSDSRPAPLFNFASYSSSSSPSPPIINALVVGSGFSATTHLTIIQRTQSYLYPSISKKSRRKQICRAAEYKFPDPIPEFADAVSKLFIFVPIS